MLRPAVRTALAALAMPRTVDPQATNRTYSRPLPFVRRASQRRIEVFSPKLGRRLSLASYVAWQLWLALEANPAVSSFCERPARLDTTPPRVIDFWVQLRGLPSGEFWLLEDASEAHEPDPATPGSSQDELSRRPDKLHGLPVRRIARAGLRDWSTPVSNWARILPYLVTWCHFDDVVLAQSIVVYLERSHTLDHILAHFADHDPPLVEAALYSLVANGRVLSPDLATSALGGHTRFARA